MELSKRLKAVAAMVSKGNLIADIGTDHGYIPIYLIVNGDIPGAVAMDINEGPLMRAKENISRYNLDNYIETRQSDGLLGLKPKEVQSVVIAGMGGALTIRIMKEGKDILDSVNEIVLQPQSEICKVRDYLRLNCWKVIDENVVKEYGKFYPVIKAVHGWDEYYSDEELLYGKILIKGKNSVLREYLLNEEKIKSQILERLSAAESTQRKIRIFEIEKELEIIEKVLKGLS